MKKASRRETRTYCTWCKAEVGTSLPARAAAHSAAHSAGGQVCPGTGLVVVTR